MQKVNPRKYVDAKTLRDGQAHQCYPGDLEEALIYIKKFGIPRERLDINGQRPSCTTKWLPIPDEEMFNTTAIYRYQTFKQALKGLRTHPGGATLVAYEGIFDSDNIYRGPFGKNAIFQDYHGVIIYDYRKINGEVVAFCKSSSGDRISLEGDKGYIMTCF